MSPIIFWLVLSVFALAFVAVVIVAIVGLSDRVQPKHPAGCDCMACGKRAAERELRRS